MRGKSSSLFRRVLLVDDDQALRQSLAEQLTLHEEFEIDEAGTGAEALESVKGQRYDLVLLDVGLPDMDGREVCKIMRRVGQKMPIIMLTAAESGVERIVYTSSIATLGLPGDGSPGDEQTPVAESHMIGYYKRSKFLAEQAVRRLIETRAAPVVSELSARLTAVMAVPGIMPSRGMAWRGWCQGSGWTMR